MTNVSTLFGISKEYFLKPSSNLRIGFATYQITYVRTLATKQPFGFAMLRSLSAFPVQVNLSTSLVGVNLNLKQTTEFLSGLLNILRALHLCLCPFRYSWHICYATNFLQLKPYVLVKQNCSFCLFWLRNIPIVRYTLIHCIGDS